MRSHHGAELFKNQAMILDDSDLTPAEKSPKNFESGFIDYKTPTLHEILIADKLDFEEKLQRAARRKQWLQSNESLLRTLLSYCSLHGKYFFYHHLISKFLKILILSCPILFFPFTN